MGTVRRGRSIALDGPGRAVIAHGIGPLAVWIEADGMSPWPQPAAQAVDAPVRLAMSGPAMALRLSPDSPVLLHATTTAPVLLALAQAGPAGHTRAVPGRGGMASHARRRTGRAAPVFAA